MPTDVMTIAKWFIKKNLDSPRNTHDGNMKIQKLLYFSQLIHLAKNDEGLFDDAICAYRDGSVVENVRLAYKNASHQVVQSANEVLFEYLTEEEKDTLELTEKLFGHLGARELSELNHLHLAWEKAFEQSDIDGFYFKENSVICLDEIKKNDIESVKQMLDLYTLNQKADSMFEVVNGIKFYYSPDEIEFSDEILEMLVSFNATEPSYSMYKDDNDVLVVY